MIAINKVRPNQIPTCSIFTTDIAMSYARSDKVTKERENIQDKILHDILIGWKRILQKKM